MGKRMIMFVFLAVSLHGCSGVKNVEFQEELTGKCMEVEYEYTEPNTENTAFSFGADITDEDFEIMEGMQSLFVLAEKENGYLMKLTGKEEEEKELYHKGL